MFSIGHRAPATSERRTITPWCKDLELSGQKQGMRQTSVDPTAAAQGDPSAVFEAFYAAYYTQVLTYARRRTDEDAAREVTAETFLVAWRRRDVAVQRGLPWLYTTAALTLRNHQRTQRRARDALARLRTHVPTVQEDHAQTHAEHEVVRAAVRTLPERDRELLMLTVWEQLDVKTAAAIAGCSTAAAHVRLHRARRRLSTLLEHRPPTGGRLMPFGENL